MTQMDSLKQAVRQWGVRLLQQWVAGTVDEETMLRLHLHASQLARELGLGDDRAAAIREAFGEAEPVTGAQIANALLAAKAGDARAVAFLESCGVPAP